MQGRVKFLQIFQPQRISLPWVYDVAHVLKTIHTTIDNSRTRSFRSWKVTSSSSAITFDRNHLWCYLYVVLILSMIPLSPRRDGGALLRPLSLRFFFREYPKTTAVFDIPVHISVLHKLWKFQTQVTQGHVTRSRQVTSPKKKVLMVVIATAECLITLKFSAIDIRTNI